jgi:formylglycine-generating enzyme required for sulfatase activity
MGDDNNPSTFTGTNLPVNNISSDLCQAFFSELNGKTQKNFRFPTQTEWEYAAQGASASKGYTYSGSNDANEVAWYSANSENTTHPVKTKLPNEIGLYDMSGNTIEFLGHTRTSDNYYSYYYFTQAGGGYDSDASISTITTLIEQIYWQNPNKPQPLTYQYTYLGFRIAIDDIE